MVSRPSTKTGLQFNKFKHKQLPPQSDFALLQNNTLKPLHYLIKHEEVVPHQKYYSHPIIAVYGTDQFPIRINDKDNVVVVTPLDSFFFKSITPFQTFSKPTSKNIINLSTNNHFYLTILMTLVMMKITFIQEFSRTQHPLHMTILLMMKTSLL